MNQATSQDDHKQPAAPKQARKTPLLGDCDGCGKPGALLYAHTRLEDDGQVSISEDPHEHFCPACIPIYRAHNDATIQLHQLITPLVRLWAAQAHTQGVEDLEFDAQRVVTIGVRQGIRDAERQSQAN